MMEWLYWNNTFFLQHFASEEVGGGGGYVLPKTTSENENAWKL